MVEDAQLHPFFAHCVWIMAAHAKGFPVQESHVQLLQVGALVFTERFLARLFAFVALYEFHLVTAS